MARRILENEPNRSTRHVLFLTFSRSATAELTRRAPQILSGDLGRRIDVSTFHSFALSMLDAFRRFAGGPVDRVVIRTREQEKLGLAPAGAMTFDEVIPQTIGLLRSADWLRRELRDRYAAVICDEYQDTGQPAADFIEELAVGPRLICLADPDQVIFDFTDDTITRRILDYQASGAIEYDLGYDSRRDPSNVIPRAAAGIRRRDFDDPAIAEACRARRLRVIQHGPEDEPFGILVREIRSALVAGAGDVGVFLATNRSVNDFAERLRAENIDHEIVGLSGAAGEAQVAAAAAARFAVGTGDWNEFMIDLGVFVASCYRGQPPALAFGLVQDLRGLEPGLVRALEAEREAFMALAGRPFEDFLDHATSFWARLFTGRPRQLWEQGLRDLRGQTLGMRRRSLDRSVSTAVTQIAAARRGLGLVDDIPAARSPVRVMNVYQVKGREMDDVLLAHLPDDRDEWDPRGMRRLSRVHYVAMSRARRRATIVLSPEPKPFFAPYLGLCHGDSAGTTLASRP
jgi:DNA helicase-2/ATP-dependent DNA helicase PcrA